MIKKTSLSAFFISFQLMASEFHFFFEYHHHQFNKFIRIKMKAFVWWLASENFFYSILINSKGIVISEIHTS